MNFLDIFNREHLQCLRMLVAVMFIIVRVSLLSINFLFYSNPITVSKQQHGGETRGNVNKNIVYASRNQCIVTNNSSSNQPVFPTRLALDSHDNLLVIDEWNACVYKFTGDGEFVAKWGSKGSGDGEFYTLKGLAASQNGTIYTIDPGFLDKNSRWGSTCILSGVYQLNAGCTDPDGQGPLSRGNGQFNHPQGIVVDRAGNVYVVDNNNRVQKFTSDGKFITKWDGEGEFYLRSLGSYALSGIAVNSKGYAYITNENERIQLFASNNLK